MLAFLAAGIIASEATVALVLFGQRIPGNDLEAVARITGYPVLAVVPRGRTSDVAESYRSLRTNLFVSNELNPPRSTAIVSATEGVGKSFSAINFAESLSGHSGSASVVLVDADCRRPVLHDRLQTRRSPGLTDVLRGVDVAKAIHRLGFRIGNNRFELLPSGSPVADPVGLLSGAAFHDLVAQMTAAKRLLIVDTPPIELFTDALAVAAQCDTTILVVDARSSRKRSVTRSIEALERSGAKISGVVVNRARVENSARRYYESASYKMRGPGALAPGTRSIRWLMTLSRWRSPVR